MLAMAEESLKVAEAAQAAEMAEGAPTASVLSSTCDSQTSASAGATAEDDEFYSDEDQDSEVPKPPSEGCVDIEAILDADRQRVCHEMKQVDIKYSFSELHGLLLNSLLPQLKDGTKSRKEMKKKYHNENLPCDFVWLHELLTGVVFRML